MKKIMLTLGIFCLIIMSCTHNDIEADYGINETEAQQTVLSVQTRTDIAYITLQLAEVYKEMYGSNSVTLATRILQLDTVSANVPLFLEIKPVNFVLPDVNSAQVFIVEYEAAYDSLDVSATMQAYFDNMVQTNTLNYYVLLQNIANDDNLTTTEKHRLQFIVTCFSDADGNGSGVIVDPFWKKRNIVAAMNGFASSDANAVFNVALSQISN